MLLPVEKRLYTYFEDLAMIERLNKEAEDILSIHGQNLQAGHSNDAKSPVEKRFELVQPLQNKIAKIKRDIEPVAVLIRDLPDILRDLFYLHYYRKISWSKISKLKQISRITLWRQKKKLLKMAQKYLGDLQD